MPLLHVSRLRMRNLEDTEVFREKVHTGVVSHFELCKRLAALYPEPSIFNTKSMSSLLDVFFMEDIYTKKQEKELTTGCEPMLPSIIADV